MASNIKIVGNILSTTQVSRYSEDDLKLISSQRIQEDFGGENDYIEYYVYDVAGNLLNTNYNYLKYKLPTSTGLNPGTTTLPNTTGKIQTENIGIDSTLATPTSSLYPIIEIDPVQDLQDLGYSSGEFKVAYNLFQTKLSNYIDSALFIKEISQDRTEIRLASTTLTNDEIESTTLSLIDEINTSPYYVSYLLNFGNNKQYVTVNTALNKAPEGYEILFKLYEPLPLEVQEKQTLWIVEEKVEPYVFDINLDKLILPPPPPTLRGPNFDIPISENQGTVSSTYQTYNALVNSVQSLQQNSYHQILNLLTTQSININIDYTDYNKFVFFGSAYQRLSNFYNKVSDIEFYTNYINTSSSLSSTTPNLLSELNRYSANISDIISKFDGYERYLYFESSSYAWPKTSSTKPFSLYSVTSSQAITWYNNTTSSAKNYDATNYNNLEYAVPVYLRDDTNNQPFLTFLNMVGHYFDNIWIYLKAITDINLANNSLTEGISKDLVYERLKSLGLKLYNSQAGEDVNQYLIGANTGSSVWDNDTTITGSYLNNIPRKDLVAELYKRIYHNLPLLLKQKGTVAGLENLITTFGLTSSILNVKEYGGSLKTDLVKGYNNDKVRIIQNTVTGSVLSPILSLQTFPTDANDFRENDSHYIDISFSPQNQIDNYISGAIASNNPTWSLDDYIGDPRQQYSTTYTDLDAQRKLYFETGTGTSLPFTASLLDYNGFIRLVEYFDNSLFKMLEDFVPERASLSTGVTINSPVLERNKAVYANPTATTTQSVHEGEIPTTSISTQYGTFYNALSSSNNTMGWFDGELSGSTVDINQYFEDNYNPYLQPSGTINQNEFQHSDWNVLLNNVSSSVQSIFRNNIEYIGEDIRPTSSIFYPAKLQDSYLSLQSYNRSRYEGTKLNSLKYNVYTPASGSYSGDSSYGTTAAIDRYSRKIGLFTQVESSSFLFKRNNAVLKYLVDEFGGLTELNQQNINWQDIQNTFLINTTSSVTLFDNKKYGNQKPTDGQKLIFESGYSYSPILYGFGLTSSKFYFENIGLPNAYAASWTSTPSGSAYYITGSSPVNFPLSGSSFAGNGKAITGIYDYLIEGSVYADGATKGGTGLSAFPTYTASEAGEYEIFNKIKFKVDSPANTGDITINTTLIRMLSGSNTPITDYSDTYTWDFAGASTVTNYYDTVAISVNYPSSPPSTYTLYGTPVQSNRDITYTDHNGITKTAPAGTTWYSYSSLLLGGGACSTSTPTGTVYSRTSFISLKYKNCFTYQRMHSDGVKYDLYTITNLTNHYQTYTKEFSFITSSFYEKNTRIQLRYYVSNLSGNVTASVTYDSDIPGGSLQIYSLGAGVTSYPYVNNVGTYTDGMFDQDTYNLNASGSLKNTLILSQEASNFYSPSYQYVPNFNNGLTDSGSFTTYSDPLYSSYGDVSYPFQLNTYDIFTLLTAQGIYFEARILNVYRVVDRVYIQLDRDIPVVVARSLITTGDIDDGPGGTGLDNTTYPSARWAFAKRVQDETNVILFFKKPTGQTSYGFLIPENISPDIIQNIDTLTRQLKQKLLADQQGQTGG